MNKERQAAFMAEFERSVQHHVMRTFRDDGVYRHIRFLRPGTMCMHFDLLTWPGYLCYTGDMGTFVFRRLNDMFEFFRRGPENPYRIDFRYWAEKVEAGDKSDGTDAFSADAFKAEVADYVVCRTADDPEWTDERKASLQAAIYADLISPMEYDGEHAAWTALRQFEHDGFLFTDWERDCKEYSHRFLWCCHALAWGIRMYDAEKARAAGVANELSDQ